MRVLAVLVGGVVLALGVAGGVSAQGTPPTVTVTASTTTTTLPPGGPLAPGPTRFEVVKSGNGDVAITMGALRAGVTLDDFTAALRRNPNDAIEASYLDGGVSLGPAEARKAVTFSLRPNATYVVLNTSGDNPATWTVTSFTTGGTANGAALPRAGATVRMVDLRFRGDSVLPRNGVVRFENRGWAPHFAIAAPLRRGASTRAVGRALRSGSDRQLGRLLDFRSSTEAQSLVTRGAVDYNEVRFPKAGRHVLVCFFEGHNTQGMYRFVRVR